MTACKADERCQLKAVVAKTMAILIYVLTDSKPMQLVHNVTVVTKVVTVGEGRRVWMGPDKAGRYGI